jgi:hypothetical protein
MADGEQSNIRTIAADRIKKLSCVQELNDSIPEADVPDLLTRAFTEQIAFELAAKLIEFKKVQKEPIGAGFVRYRTAIEIIVPPTPNDHI